MRIEFEIKKPTDIPAIKNERLQISDRYYAKIKNISDDISKTTVIYDHKNSKWLSIHTGMKELIEYYVEVEFQGKLF